MKTLLSVLALSVISSSAFADTCNDRMKTAAVIFHAGASGNKISKIKVIGITPGVWTEAVGNNVGSNSVTVKGANGKINFYDVSGKQIGTTDDCVVTDVTGAGAQG